MLFDTVALLGGGLLAFLVIIVISGISRKDDLETIQDYIKDQEEE